MAEQILKISRTAIKQGLIRLFVEKTHSYGWEVYTVICAYSKDGKTSEVSAQTLIDKTGLSRGTVFKCIGRLEQANFIKRSQDKKGCTQVFHLLDVE